MIGLGVSLMFGLIMICFGRRWQEAYSKSTVLLFWWNLAITMFLSVVLFSGTAFISGLGGWFFGATGFLMGIAGGGLALSLVMFFMIVMSVVQTTGTVLLNNAVEKTPEGEYKWNVWMLVTGALLFFIGLSRIFG